MKFKMLCIIIIYAILLSSCDNTQNFTINDNNSVPIEAIKNDNHTDNRANNLEKQETKIIDTNIHYIDDFNFKEIELVSGSYDYNFIGSLYGNPYGIGGYGSRDPFAIEKFFYDNNYQTEDNNSVINLSSVHKINDNEYSFVDYSDSDLKESNICSFNIITNEKKPLFKLDKKDGSIITDAYVCDDNLYYILESVDKHIYQLISSEIGILTKYNVDDNIAVYPILEDNKFYYLINNVDSDSKLFNDKNELLYTVSDFGKINSLEKYDNYFIFTGENKLLIYNIESKKETIVEEISASGVQIYEDKLYITVNFSLDNGLFVYDLSENRMQKLVNYDDTRYVFSGILDNKIIMRYVRSQTNSFDNIEGIAVYNIDDGIFMKFNELARQDFSDFASIEILLENNRVVILKRDHENSKLYKMIIDVDDINIIS